MRIGFIGSGNMGASLARAVSRLDEVKVYVYDKDQSRALSVCNMINAEASSLISIAESCDYIFLGVKPNIIPEVCRELDSAIGANSPVIVSMAAGVDIASIEGYFSAARAIIRIMPNTPASIGKGMILWCRNAEVSDSAAEGFERIMKHSGSLDAIPEKLIDAASAVSGCGPAFVFMFIEALADGGVKCGLPREKALLYAAETLIGAAELLKATGKHPEELKDAVCSPGGSTIAGVAALESGAFRSTAINAVVSAYERTLELGK